MSNSYKFYSDTKDIMKKYVNATEGAIIYGISKSRIMVLASEAGAVYISAWDGEKLIGLINALDDGELTAYVHYLLVNPEYQKDGIGTKEGSTIIILKADYLKTLSVGTHSFEIVWADGSAVTSFKVSKNTSDNEGSKDNNGNKDNSNDNPNSNPAAVPDDKKTNGSNSGNNTDDSQQITAPQTGDNSHLMLWVTLLAASLAGLLALLSVRMKKDDE